MIRDYVKLTYADKPFTSYPAKLAAYIVKRYNLKAGARLIDLGCGRGEFMLGFYKLGIHVYGVDQSDELFATPGIEAIPTAYFIKEDLKSMGIPCIDAICDVVFIKSVLEHFYNPEQLVDEAWRVLKPGGFIITLTPEAKDIGFFDSFTHRTPFGLNSMRELLCLSGFKKVEVERFMQLPVVWNRPVLTMLARVVAKILPDFMTCLYFVKWAKAKMILGTGVKI